ncbi:hypothetical protein E6H16_01395 [Candidatus Bathyarchaeota archaeon]|nr:MAG: hypothetical protein AUG75_03735 [Cyanobacteria bacterium 13_1_20CM_4_61_6]TMI68692.1 MAG: hypothetical protein E6H16_01395 [Candidatus Bathyarchaeota archaeon]
MSATADFVVQTILGFIALNSTLTVVIHLTNAFLLGVFTTYLIGFADSAEKTGAVIARAATKGSSLRPA